MRKTIFGYLAQNHRKYSQGPFVLSGAAGEKLIQLNFQITIQVFTFYFDLFACFYFIFIFSCLDPCKLS